MVKKRHIFIVFITVAAAFLAVWALSGRPGRRPPETNVILVSYDTVRPDHLGCYGHENIDTGNTDYVADKGVLFTQALTSVPITLPSHCSVMTGKEIYSHGVRENGPYLLRGEFQTLAEILSMNGYATGAVIGAFPLERRFGLDQGFEFYEDSFAEKGKKKGVWRGHEVGGFGRSAKDVADIAIHWIQENKDKRFFLWVHFFDAHNPYTPPEEYATAYGPTQDGLYDGEIAYVDDQFGRILNTVIKNGLLSKTLIVLFSDHGEVLGEHTLGEHILGENVKAEDRETPYFGHGVFVYEGELRSALIMMHQGLLPAGTKVDGMVRLSDVTPTIVDLLGIRCNSGFDGRSLLPLIRGEEKTALKRMYCETVYSKERYNESGVYSLRTEEAKIVSMPKDKKTLLFDLSKNSEEKRSVEPGDYDKSYVESMLSEIQAFTRVAERESRRSTFNLDREGREKLKALGYLQ